MAVKCADRCKTRPMLDTLATIQQPSTSVGDRNDHHERDPEAWTDVRLWRCAVRNRRASEIIAVDQVEGVRFVSFEGQADALTANLPTTHRLQWRDRWNVLHTANVTGVRPDGAWVVIDAEEKT